MIREHREDLLGTIADCLTKCSWSKRQSFDALEALEANLLRSTPNFWPVGATARTRFSACLQPLRIGKSETGTSHRKRRCGDVPRFS
ncbi:hypothetical protein AKJ09_02386 [Labilithrix luteola]|uniref:Uncharacterized protein n=1 Tax=Labilithrix luteola TaxID=1391654 RepID=A0A0K1PQC8_9BACT|nr:hypothetical protein AKJ09_02386 [Labilithrix luteola]